MAEINNNKGISMKMIIVLMIVMIIITGIFSYLFMSYFATQANRGEDNNEIEDKKGLGPTYNLGEFTVNLSGSGGYQFIKATMVVEVNQDEVITELDKRNPQVRDIIILTLREQMIEDIEEPGAQVIKNQLMIRVNQILRSGKIINIWFTQLVVQ